jgi:hypothetical protein
MIAGQFHRDFASNVFVLESRASDLVIAALIKKCRENTSLAGDFSIRAKPGFPD